MRYAIAVHGGAGSHGNANERQIKLAMKRSCLKAAEVLKGGNRTSLDAVEAAIRELEDDELFNAGYGSNLTMDKRVECDAAIMAGNGSFGGVGAIEGIKNPISAARVVLERGRRGRPRPLGRVPPVMLCGTGAVSYVLEECNGMSTEEQLFSLMQIPKESLVSHRAEEEWEYWHNQYHSVHAGDSQPVERLLGDTVGAVVCCENGDIAAGVSSGGLLLKHPGRIGEAAIYGAGCWAESSKNPGESLTGIGSSVSGTGEQIIAGNIARKIGENCNPAQCDDSIGSLNSIFEKFIESQRGNEHENKIDVQVGAITVTLDEEEGVRSVRLFVAFTTSSMAVASFTSDEREPSASIRRQGRHPGDSENPIYLSATRLINF
ncbi:N-terminal nucleophile aminohydrolase [Serendipita vermifera]|nr:N-terminal nucleophile aminohydrolase [Serendipita vermifera]